MRPSPLLRAIQPVATPSRACQHGPCLRLSKGKSVGLDSAWSSQGLAPQLGAVRRASSSRHAVRAFSSSTWRRSIDAARKASRGKKANLGVAAVGLGILTSALLTFGLQNQVLHADAHATPVSPLFGAEPIARPQKPPTKQEKQVEVAPEQASTPRTIRLAELPNHDAKADTKWVTRGASVYDITDFVEAHPGGEVILRACGGSIDPYWKIITIHQKQEVYDILNEFYIGDIDARDLKDGQPDWGLLGQNIGFADPFKDDPKRDAALMVHTAKPCNAETPASYLTSFLTPLHLFFVRNHLWVPRLDPAAHTLTIELSSGDEKTYTLEDLKARFKEHTITTTLQCAGNRRAHMSTASLGKTAGLQWDVGAIGTAEFTGVRLRDVLRDAGYDIDGALDSSPTSTSSQTPSNSSSSLQHHPTDAHIHFTSPGDTYSASVPLRTALSPTADVLLAHSMNGAPIPRDHGGPLRAIVPGTVAARSVKWLGRITISAEESPSQWQRRDYRAFGPNIDAASADWDAARSIQEMPVQSAITTVADADIPGKVALRGFAYSGGGRAIVRVDVSGDGGKTWCQAKLLPDQAKGTRRWAWTQWSAELPAAQQGQGEREFVVKAVDEGYNTQPEGWDAVWNFRGLVGSAWHRVVWKGDV